ncbi:MAG: hypothetical protein HFF84_09710 [Oscillibacter sp.]|nr:hypothetical protein [Oscillibacter sp.]
MSMFPHTITMYNVEIYTDKTTFKDVLVNHITILRGVLLDASKAVNVRESGLVGADAVNLYIPFSVVAVDGVTRAPKEYAGPVEFWRAEDKSRLWTMSIGGTKAQVDGSCFFVKGEAVHPDLDAQAIEMMYDHVYGITTIDEKDFGGLPHWEIGAS